jgi:hypothetical protein
MTSSVITFGARVDSLYEYFLKQVHPNITYHRLVMLLII